VRVGGGDAVGDERADLDALAAACTRMASTVSPTSSPSGTRWSVQAMSPASRRENSNRSSISADSASMCVRIPLR
jgi:hypothetical protein